MRLRLNQAALGTALLTLLACSKGGDADAPSIVTGPGSMPSTTVAVFDPAAGKIPLPNILATATAANPLTGRLANKPMTPPEALAYVNLKEVGGTNAVSGLNSPIYIQFGAAVDAATVTSANIKVFQLTPDATGTENAALGFSDISAMFTYRYTAGGTDLFLYPNFPLSPGTRYLYVVTNRVKDTAGLPISGAPFFEALKAVTPLAGSFAALEPIRANATSGANILLSGYAKVMDDLITASSTTTVTQRSQIALLGRFITTAAGAISLNTTSPTASGASLLPMETALRSFAAGANIPGNLPGRTWSNTIAVTATFDRGGANPSPDAYWSASGLGATAPASVGTIVTGTINSADLSMDPVVVAANAASLNLTGVAGAYNPAAGVVQAFRPNGLNLTGFYSTNRTVPFVYIAPSTAAPVGGYPLVIYAHGIGGQKEHALAVAQSLTMINRAVIAIDHPLHGELQAPGHTTGSVWFQDFVALGAPLALRSNVQQSAFHLHRLELTVRLGGFAGLGGAAPSLADIKFVGHSLGSIVGAYYLAGNTTLATSGAPYSQTTLDSDMKGYLSVAAGRWGYIGQDAASTSFEPTITAGLAAVGIVKNSPAYHQFFLVTQTIGDPTDPATMTTPLAAGLPSRLSGRVAIQESTGETAIPNSYTRYLGNALGGRAVLGTAAAAAVAPGFKQLAYTAGGTPAHAAGVPAQFMFTLTGGALAPKVANAAVALTDLTPTEGYFQFDQTGIGHGSLIDPSNMVNLGLIQRQLRYFMGATGTSIVVDPTQGTALPLAPVALPEVQFQEKFPILGH
jgi:hypothetical protein